MISIYIMREDKVSITLGLTGEDNEKIPRYKNTD